MRCFCSAGLHSCLSGVCFPMLSYLSSLLLRQDIPPYGFIVSLCYCVILPAEFPGLSFTLHIGFQRNDHRLAPDWQLTFPAACRPEAHSLEQHRSTNCNHESNFCACLLNACNPLYIHIHILLLRQWCCVIARFLLRIKEHSCR